MAGLVPAIHVYLFVQKTWMPGTGPGMTAELAVGNIRDYSECRFVNRALPRPVPIVSTPQ